MRHDPQILLALILLLFAGCDSGRDSIGITGCVAFDGAAIEKGEIDFIPIEGTPGRATMAAIANGQYAIDAEHGLLNDGIYQVRISGMRKTGKKTIVPKRMLPSVNSPSVVESEENFIPPMYNSQSTLKVRIADLPDRNSVDFHLGKK